MNATRWNQKGKVIVMSETTDEPISMIGQLSGICWDADTTNHEKNFKRGLDCIKSGHGRTLEYPQIYMILSGWSARVMREFMRHNGGDPSYLQASTRYIDYKNFNYIVPPQIKNNPEAWDAFEGTMDEIRMTADYLENDLGVKREDCGMVLPLAMETKVVVRTNLRMLYDMAKVRKCQRAYWEFRELFKEIEEALCIYSDEWEYLIKDYKIFRSKCDWMGYCDETHSCGRKIKRKDFEQFIEMAEFYHKQHYDGRKVKDFTLEEENG